MRLLIQLQHDAGAGHTRRQGRALQAALEPLWCADGTQRQMACQM